MKKKRDVRPQPLKLAQETVTVLQRLGDVNGAMEGTRTWHCGTSKWCW